jgi:hypothetical protein
MPPHARVLLSFLVTLLLVAGVKKSNENAANYYEAAVEQGRNKKCECIFE